MRRPPNTTQMPVSQPSASSNETGIWEVENTADILRAQPRGEPNTRTLPPEAPED